LISSRTTAWLRLSSHAPVDTRKLATLYLAILGSLQIVFLWSYRVRFGPVIPLLGMAVLLVLLLVMLRVAEAWRWKVLLLAGLIAITTFGPGVAAILARVHTGLTFECDCMAMDEVAVDRVMHGRGIYGVDWSGTQVDGYAQVWGGADLHYYAHFPLMVISAIPVRFLSDLIHVSFDYRMVVIGFSLIAMGAIALLPVPVPARFIVAVAIFLNPALSLGAWTGHDDMVYLAMLLLGLALLSRRHWLMACLVLGTAAALKPFALLALPLLLAIIWLQRNQSRRTRGSRALVTCVVFGMPTLLSLGPFLLTNAAGVYRDIFVYPTSLLPIGRFGLGGIAVTLHLISPDDRFSFGPIQLLALIPAFWLGIRALAARLNLGQFLASYGIALFAFLFTTRYLADNYGAALMALFLCVPGLITAAVPGPSSDAAPHTARPAERAA
jgi:hypothetical protein